MASACLGIDFGARRVGLAVSTGGSRPHRLVTLTNNDELLEHLGRQIKEHQVAVAVLGLPRNLDGDDTPQTTAVRRFAAQLQRAHPQLTIVLQDEALTSEVARQRLEAEKVSDVKALLDQEAAVIMLEDYLSAA